MIQECPRSCGANHLLRLLCEQSVGVSTPVWSIPERSGVSVLAWDRSVRVKNKPVDDRSVRARMGQMLSQSM